MEITVLGVDVKMDQTFPPWSIAHVFPGSVLHGLVVEGLEVGRDTLANLVGEWLDDFTPLVCSEILVVLGRGVLHRDARLDHWTPQVSQLRASSNYQADLQQRNMCHKARSGKGSSFS